MVQPIEGNNRPDCSLADLKRLKKHLVQISSTARLEGISLVEVDCDLGAGKPGAGAGIELLKNAAKHQQDLRKISEGLIAEIRGDQAPSANAATAGQSTTPHARHIQTIAGVMQDAAQLVCTTPSAGLLPAGASGRSLHGGLHDCGHPSCPSSVAAWGDLD